MDHGQLQAVSPLQVSDGVYKSELVRRPLLRAGETWLIGRFD